MKRKPALAIAATTALIGAAGVVAFAAVTGANVFGFHVGSHVAAPAPTTSSSAETAPPSSADDTVATLPPAVVMQTEFVDQFVTVTTAAPRAVVQAAPARSASPVAAAPQTVAAPVTQPPATAPAVVTPPAPVVTEATTAATPPPTPAPTAPPTTLFDRSRYPFKITIPAGWGSKPVPPVPTPAAGRQWSECELHDSGWWECQYP